MKATGYVRVSTEDQAKEGASLDNQKDRIRAYCQYKGVELVGTIEDTGISGGIHKAREGFISLLNHIEQGGPDIIILYSLERLSRDMLTLLAIERLVDEYGIELHTIEGQVDTSTPDGFMNFAMKAFLGEMERRQVKHRTKEALEYKKGKGEVVGNMAYGYQRKGKNLVPDLNEQAIIKTVNDFYSQGYRLVDIVGKLNNRGKRTRAGNPWKASQVRNLIVNYRGKFKKTQTKVSDATRQFIETIA
jgi:site-specific DNA recombinase